MSQKETHKIKSKNVNAENILSKKWQKCKKSVDIKIVIWYITNAHRKLGAEMFFEN